jgi:CTP-dependent riboflavin kinase
MTNLTTAETQILVAVGQDNIFTYFDGSVTVNSGIWTTVFAEEIAQLLGTNEQAAGGHITNLHKKGIMHTEQTGDGAWSCLTETGVALINELMATDKVGA